MKRLLTAIFLCLVTQVSGIDFFAIFEDSFSEPSSDEMNCAATEVVYRIYFSQDWGLLGTSEVALISLRIRFPEGVGDLREYPILGFNDDAKVELVLKRKIDGKIVTIESNLEEDIVSDLVLTFGRNELFAMDQKKAFENYSEVLDGNMVFAERIRGEEVRRVVRKVEESIPAQTVWHFLNRVLARHVISNK